MVVFRPWEDPAEVGAMTRKTDSTAVVDASAEVFVVAFKALPQKTRRKVLSSLLELEDWREDVEAALLWEERKDEPRRSFREYLAEHPEP